MRRPPKRVAAVDIANKARAGEWKATDQLRAIRILHLTECKEWPEITCAKPRGFNGFVYFYRLPRVAPHPARSASSPPSLAGNGPGVGGVI